MKIVIKKLQGSEFSLEVAPTTSILDIKRQISRRIKIPPDQQKLLLLGRTLADDQNVQAYPNLKDGTRLNLIVKRPENLFQASVKYFKSCGLSEAEAVSKANRFLNVIQEKFCRLSWDDIDRLSLDCMRDMNGHKRSSHLSSDSDCKDMYGL